MNHNFMVLLFRCCNVSLTLTILLLIQKKHSPKITEDVILIKKTSNSKSCFRILRPFQIKILSKNYLPEVFLNSKFQVTDNVKCVFRLGRPQSNLKPFKQFVANSGKQYRIINSFVCVIFTLFQLMSAKILYRKSFSRLVLL